MSGKERKWQFRKKFLSRGKEREIKNRWKRILSNRESVICCQMKESRTSKVTCHCFTSPGGGVLWLRISVCLLRQGKTQKTFFPIKVLFTQEIMIITSHTIIAQYVLMIIYFIFTFLEDILSFTKIKHQLKFAADDCTRKFSWVKVRNFYRTEE